LAWLVTAVTSSRGQRGLGEPHHRGYGVGRSQLQMSLKERLSLYEALEAKRGRPLVVYVTSSRQRASGQMASDVVSELLAQLQTLPADADALDLLIVSQGGDPTVAWRVVSLIRERVKKFAVLVPQAAFSAATLMALGADEIVMHRYGNLGPVDPQVKQRPKGEQDSANPTFGYEDLAAFLRYAQETVGLSDQQELLAAFKLFCDEVGAVPIGVAARSSQLTVSLGEKLLSLHMAKSGDSQKPRAIAEALNKSYFHHGYPVNRSEAKQIGLNVTYPESEVEDLLWRIWLDIEEELKVREPFTPLALLADNPDCAPLYSPIPHAVVPENLPPPLLQQVFNQILSTVQVVGVPPTPLRLISGVVESHRLASRFVTEGKIFALRRPDLQIAFSMVVEREGWKTVETHSEKREEQ
jgi:hypothetical protein